MKKYFVSKSDKAIKISVTAVSGALIILFGALLVMFFAEKSNGGDAWTNLGMIFISIFLAVPMVAVLPFWIISLTRKPLFLPAVICYIIVLLLFLICLIIGWVYPA